MRKLKFKDGPRFCRVAKALDIKEKLKAVCEKANDAHDIFSNGFNIIWELIDIATEKNAEAMIYEFLADIFEITPEEVGDLELNELSGYLKQLSEDNDLPGFFSSVAGLMK